MFVTESEKSGEVISTARNAGRSPHAGDSHQETGADLRPDVLPHAPPLVDPLWRENVTPAATYRRREGLVSRMSCWRRPVVVSAVSCFPFDIWRRSGPREGGESIF